LKAAAGASRKLLQAILALEMAAVIVVISVLSVPSLRRPAAPTHVAIAPAVSQPMNFSSSGGTVPWSKPITPKTAADKKPVWNVNESEPPYRSGADDPADEDPKDQQPKSAAAKKANAAPKTLAQANQADDSAAADAGSLPTGTVFAGITPT